MKGLLLKDLYMATKYCRSFLLVIVVFLSISFLGEVWMSTMVILLAMTLLAPAISLPFMFKLGVEKGRIAYYIALAVVGGTAAALAKVIVEEMKTQSLFGSPLPILCLGAIALYAISWYLSIVWYQRREIN